MGYTLDDIASLGPRVRGTSTLQAILKKEVIHSVHVSSANGNVILSLDGGKFVVSFDNVAASNLTTDGADLASLVLQRQDAPLESGLLCCEIKYPLLTVIQDRDRSDLFYFVTKARFVYPVKYDVLNQTWTWPKSQDVLMLQSTRRQSGDIDTLLYDPGRRIVVWTEKHEDSQLMDIYSQDLIGGRLASEGDVLFEEVPQGQLLQHSDIAYFIPQRPTKRISDIFMWNLGRKQLQIYHVGLGILSNNSRQNSLNFPAVFRDIVLPARLKYNQKGLKCEVLCATSHELSGQLILLEENGSVLGIKMDATGACKSKKICYLHDFDAKSIGPDPKLFFHDYLLGLIGSMGTVLYTVMDGVLIKRVSKIPNEVPWSSFGDGLPRMGLWSSQGGLRQLRGLPLKKQCQAILKVHKDKYTGNQVAAKLAELHNNDCLAAHFAIQAILALVPGKADDTSDPSSNASIIAKCKEMLPICRRATQGPSIVVALLSQYQQFHGLLMEELRIFEDDYFGRRHEPGSKKLSAQTPLNKTMQPLLKRYHDLETVRRNIFGGSSDFADAAAHTPKGFVDAVTVDNAVQTLLTTTVDWSTSSAGNQNRVGRLHDFALREPMVVLRCVLTHLRLETALEVGMPPAVEYIKNVPDAHVLCLELLPESVDVASATSAGNGNIPLFELTVRLLFELKPTLLSDFVMFCAHVTKEKDAFPRVAYFHLKASNILPTIEKETEEHVKAHASLLKNAGKEYDALGVLLRGSLWDEALEFVRSYANEDLRHAGLFQKLLANLIKHDVVEKYASALFDLKNGLAPHNYSLNDLFRTLKMELTKDTTHPLADDNCFSVRSLRDQLIKMFKSPDITNLDVENNKSEKISVLSSPVEV
eukprot:m.22182 g.22182  ORF g.22182 m.22182 type:complete len:870 (-) comp7367_c0_seq1:77-2686(-)